MSNVQARVTELLADRSIPYMARSHDGRPLAECDVYLAAPEAEGIAAVLAEAGLLAERDREQCEHADDLVGALEELDAALKELAEVKAERDEAQEHIARWLGQNPPLSTTERVASGLTGDLSVDMMRYAERMKSRAEKAVAALSRVHVLSATGPTECGHCDLPHELRAALEGGDQ